MSDETAVTGKLDIGRVISETFAVIGRNFSTFGVLSLLLAGIPMAAISYLQAAALGPGLSGGMPQFSPAYLGAMGGTGFALLVTSAILQGALIYGTVQDMNGARPSVSDCLSRGLAAFLPLVGLSILFALGVMVSLVFVIVPGLMLACAWSVAVPSLVADRTGVIGAFGRSGELTRGNRWRIFGLFIIVWVVAVVVTTVIGAVMLALSFASGGMNPAAMLMSPVSLIGNAVIRTLTAMIASTGVAVLYVELRRTREGQGAQWLAEVFG